MIKIHILGTAQDGGVPHMGCSCTNCQQASDYPIKRRKVASIAIAGKEKVILVDATPDIVQQASLLKQTYGDKALGFDNLLLTHLHIGHYIGLVMFGREAAATSNFPIYTTKSVYDYLSHNKPFSYLLDRDQIRPNVLVPSKSIQLDPDFKILPVQVPHRNEDGDTIGILISALETDQTILYIPDIDYLDPDIVDLIRKVDSVLFDGTFYSKNEIPRQENVPHPPIQTTISKIGRREPGSFYFTHFNHTNPVIKYGEEYDKIQELGFEIAQDGQILDF